MDRTSRIGLGVCLFLFVIFYSIESKYYPPPAKLPQAAASAQAAPSPVAPPAGNPPSLTSGPTPPGQPPAPPPPVEEKFSALENDTLKVTFTSIGAAIKDVELKTQEADDGGYIILNQQSHTNVLALSGWPGADTANFTAREDPGHAITFTTDLPNGLRWQRKYAFGQESEQEKGIGGFFRVMFHKLARHLGQHETKPEVYTLDVVDTLTNPGAADITLPSYSLSVGRAEPLYDPATQWSKRSPSYSNSMYLGSGWFASGYHLTTVNDFNSASQFFFFPLHGPRDLYSSADVDNAPLSWLGVENQFFVMLLTPAGDKSIIHAEFSVHNDRDSNGNIPRAAVPDIEAAAFLPAVTVPAGQSVALTYSVYAGPKDFNRLDALGQNQGALMNYDGFLPFSWLIVPMLTVLHFWHLIFNNYGVAIILLTLMIKAVTWPLQSKANRAGKKMQALAPLIKEIQAKYKDQPEKLQKETFALYGKYGINPVGGCWPAMIQMPVFFSLYFMLQNAVELRGQSFLWVHDLTKPDNVWTAPFLFFGFHPSLHPLPIMVTALTMVMMRMTPQIGDPQQAKIAQMMPLIFLFIFYNFAAALSLYYVINNCVSIFQIYRNLKKPLPELKPVPKKKSKE
jgi:YidC/Oxa1 family membrane protein insertase